jgi:hypothetical protein
MCKFPVTAANKPSECPAISVREPGFRVRTFVRKRSTAESTSANKPATKENANRVLYFNSLFASAGIAALRTSAARNNYHVKRLAESTLIARSIHARKFVIWASATPAKKTLLECDFVPLVTTQLKNLLEGKE